MTKPLVTIVLPTYNGSHYLAQSIESCLAQTYEHLDIVIVDDASTDQTPALISRFLQMDQRLRVIRHSQNRRLPGALNTGFATANGTYLTWTSDDNLYESHAIATMVGFLESHPDAAFVYTDFTEIDEAGQQVRSRSVPLPADLANGNRLGACFLYRREVQEVLGGYNESLFLAEDYDYWLRVATHFELQPLHVNCYRYRIHQKSLSSTRQAEVLAMMASTLIRHLPGLWWMDNSLKGLASCRAAFQLAEAGKFMEAKVALRMSLVDYRVLDTHPDFFQNSFLYGFQRPNQDLEQLLSQLSTKDEIIEIARRLALAGRTDSAEGIVRSLISNDDVQSLPETLGKLLVSQSSLRSEEEFDRLLSLIPHDVRHAGNIRKALRGQYYGTLCFQDFRICQPEDMRRYVFRALRYHPGWMKNRGFVRVALGVFAGDTSRSPEY